MGKSQFAPLMSLDPFNAQRSYCSMSTFSYIYDLWSTVPGDVGGVSPLYIYNDFIPQTNLTHKYADSLLTLMNETDLVEKQYGFYTACGTMIGGRNNLERYPNGEGTSVGPGMRSAYFAMSIDIF